MSTEIVKPNRDVDYYVEWSSIVDAPCQHGDRAHMLAQGLKHGWERVEPLLARADATGTSARWYESSWDTDETFHLENRGWFCRSQMADVATAYFAHDEATLTAILRPFAEEPVP